MDEIIQILIFAGAMIFSVIVQSAKKKKQEKPSPQEVLEEVFPELEEFPKDMPTEEQPIQKPVSPPKRKPFKPLIKPEPIKPVMPSTPAKKQSKVRLNSKEEARRAFIYSEIFNRKY